MHQGVGQALMRAKQDKMESEIQGGGQGAAKHHFSSQHRAKASGNGDRRSPRDSACGEKGPQKPHPGERKYPVGLQHFFVSKVGRFLALMTIRPDERQERWGRTRAAPSFPSGVRLALSFFMELGIAGRKRGFGAAFELPVRLPAQLIVWPTMSFKEG